MTGLYILRAGWGIPGNWSLRLRLVEQWLAPDTVVFLGTPDRSVTNVVPRLWARVDGWRGGLMVVFWNVLVDFDKRPGRLWY